MARPVVSDAAADLKDDFAKRVFDIAAAAAGVLVLAPALIIIAAAIQLDSRGPVIFRQQRIGRNGEAFTIFKFRTMTDKVDDKIHREAIKRLWAGEKLSDDPGSPYKLAADPRVTRVGRWLRRTSLDELPQLFNVLRGDMSIVGPRPMIDYEVADFQPWHHERHQVRPGITGLAQVRARGRADLDEILRLDVEYVKSSGFLFDIKLILETVPVVFRGLGAR